MRSLAACLLVLALVFAGCIGPDGDGLVSEAEDAGPFWDATAAVTAKDDTGDVTRPFSPVPAGPEIHLDLLEAALVDATAEGLTVSLRVAELTEAGPMRLPGFIENSLYAVCWSLDTGEDRCANLERSFNSGPVVDAASFSIGSESCNEFRQCLWQVPAELEYGSPGMITWNIPWELALWGKSGTKIDSLEAYSMAIRGPEATGQHGAFSFTLPDVPHQHQHPIGAPFLPHAQDTLDAADVDIQLKPPAGSAVERSHRFARDGAQGYTWGMDRHTTAAIDLVGLELLQEDDHLFVQFKVADLPAIPEEDFHLTLDLGVAGSEFWEIGLYQVLNPNHLGEVYAYAGRCITWHCGEGYAHGRLQIVDYEVTFGSPGTYTVKAPLEHIGGTHLREVTLLRAWAMTVDAALFWGSPGDEIQGDVHMMRETDLLYGGAPFWIGREDGQASQPHEH
jgi:hypothetical protein